MLIDAADGGNTIGEYQDLFRTMSDCFDRLDHASLTLKHHPLNVEHDDVENLDDDLIGKTSKALFNAIRELPDPAAVNPGEKWRQIHREQNDRYKEITEMLRHRDNLLDASACMCLLVYTVKDVHENGIPTATLKHVYKDDGEIEPGITKLRHRDLEVDLKTSCLTRLTVMMECLRENKYIGLDLLRSRSREQSLVFACAPRGYHELRMRDCLEREKDMDTLKQIEELVRKRQETRKETMLGYVRAR